MTPTFQKTLKKVLMTKQNRINPALEKPLDDLIQHATKSKSACRQMQCLAIVVKNTDGAKSGRKKRKRGRNLKGKKTRYKGLKVKTKRFRFRRRIPSDGGEGENIVSHGSSNKHEKSFRASARGRRWISRSPPRRLFRRNRRNNVQRKLNLHLMLQVQSRQNILTIIAAYIESGVVRVKRNLMAEDFLIQVRRPLIRTMRSGGVLEKEAKLDILQKYPTAWLMVIEQLRNHPD